MTLTYRRFIILLLCLFFIPSHNPVAHASVLTTSNTFTSETYQTINGKQLNFQQLQGKKVMLHFWATWCPPCKEELREIEALHRMKNKEMAIVSVAVQSEKEKVYRLNKALELSYPTILEKQEKLSKKYQVTMLPTTFLIQDGKVVKKHVGALTLNALQEFVK